MRYEVATIEVIIKLVTSEVWKSVCERVCVYLLLCVYFYVSAYVIRMYMYSGIHKYR